MCCVSRFHLLLDVIMWPFRGSKRRDAATQTNIIEYRWGMGDGACGDSRYAADLGSASTGKGTRYRMFMGHPGCGELKPA